MPDKTPLLLLPGFLCDETVWRPQIEALSEIAGCACADWKNLDSIAAMAESVLASAPPRFTVAGHSMGGRVALEIYRRAPDRVLRLALFNTGYEARPKGTAGEEEERRRRALLELARTKGMRAMTLEWLPAMVHPARRHDAALVETIAGMFERKSPRIFEAQMNALLARPDATSVLSGIACKTLVLTGREDGWSPPARHEAMTAQIPGAELVIVPDSGHMSTLERPQEVARAMRAWLE